MTSRAESPDRFSRENSEGFVKKGKKRKLSGAAAARQRASITRNDLINAARVCKQQGIELKKNDWLFVIAHVLASGPEGRHKIPVKHQRRAPFWRGLELTFLRDTAADCGLEVTDEELENYMNLILRWRKKQNWNGALSPDTIAKKLGITPEIRREAGCRFIGAIGETPADRKAIRRAKEASWRAEQRLMAGCTPRSQSLSQTKPWEPMGISRRTWERRRKANGLVQADANTASSITVFERADDEFASGKEEAAARIETLSLTPLAARRREHGILANNVDKLPALQSPETMCMDGNL